MTGRITLVGAGELMAAMSGLHRTALGRLEGQPRPVFLDTTAGYETNIDAIVEKAVEYYQHHLQTPLRVARFRHGQKDTPAEIAAAVAEVRAANLVFAGPGSPTYAIRQWSGSPVWDEVMRQFQGGADLFFASAASITLGRYALPVYEIYKAGEDPFWADGLDVLGTFGLQLAIIPHYNDSSGGENYDSRFCYMGAQRFDQLQECLPSDVAILGIDAYTAICFDPSKGVASVSGQGGITLITGGAERRLEAGAVLPFEAFHSSSREVVRTFDPDHGFGGGYEFADDAEQANSDPMGSLSAYIQSMPQLTGNQKVELLARLEAVRQHNDSGPPANDAPLVDLVLELRSALREAKRFDLADKARNELDALGYEIGDTRSGATWTRR